MFSLLGIVAETVLHLNRYWTGQTSQQKGAPTLQQLSDDLKTTETKDDGEATVDTPIECSAAVQPGVSMPTPTRASATTATVGASGVSESTLKEHGYYLDDVRGGREDGLQCESQPPEAYDDELNAWKSPPRVGREHVSNGAEQDLMNHLEVSAVVPETDCVPLSLPQGQMRVAAEQDRDHSEVRAQMLAREAEVTGSASASSSSLPEGRNTHDVSKQKEDVNFDIDVWDEAEPLWDEEEAVPMVRNGPCRVKPAQRESLSFPSHQQHQGGSVDSSDATVQESRRSFGATGFTNTSWEDLARERNNRMGMGRREIGGDEAKIMVKNIPYKVRVSELRRFFGTFGKVIDVYLLQENLRSRSRSKGMAFVTFSSPDGVKNVLAVKTEELTLHGRILIIEHAEPRNRKKTSWEMHKDETRSKNTNQQQFADATTNDDEDGDKEGVAVATSYDTSSSDSALIHKLHDEILMKIFILLELKDRITVERVCKRWQVVARASWQSAQMLTFANIFKGFKFTSDDSFSESIGLTDTILHSILLRGCRNLLSLDLSASPHLLTHKSLELIGHRCTKLEKVNLTGLAVTNVTLKQLTKRCSLIKEFILQRSIGVGEKGIRSPVFNKDAAFWWLFHNCPHLEYIDTRESKRFRGKCFHILNENCHTVIVSGCNRVDDSSIYELTSKCMTQLKCLDISHCYNLTDKAVRLIAQNCTQLTKLDMSGLKQGVTPSGLFSLEHMSELLELRLSQNAAVNDQVLARVGAKCKKLRSMDVSGCYDGIHDEGLLGLAACEQLQMININYLDQVTDEGLKHLTSHCSQLKKILARACVLLTDDAIIHTAYQCPSLEDFDISACENLTNRALDGFVDTRCSSGEDMRALQLTVGGTEIDAEYASDITSKSNGSLLITMHNLAVPIKKFCTEAFFGSDDVSDDDDNVEEPVAVVPAGDDWGDEYMGLPPDQFADADAADVKPSGDPVPAGYHNEEDRADAAEVKPSGDPVPASYHNEAGRADVKPPGEPVPAGYHTEEDRGEAEADWHISDDMVNDFLDADDPSMWDEENWMLS